MNYNYVSSSNLRAVAYDERTQTLGIIFHGNSEYHYYGVPHSVYVGLMNSVSKGRYHHAAIRNRYRYRKIR
ncbi:KTSC domain-containing protein [Ignatzschineria cameli]|uniref:KTSC domain-containing protein n=1 Tax=Ignatzschineria cameli TaxID=2182793 RepID=UPI000D6200F5|nr:KTSC domain-containing protein [Ignatzschineria cameli]